MARKKLDVSDGQRKFTMIYNDFLDSEVLDLREKMVYMCLKRHGNVCWPSVATIAKMSRMAENSARKAIASLIEKGVLKKEERRDENNGGTTSNLYTLYDHPAIWNAGTKKESEKIVEVVPALNSIEMLLQKGLITEEVFRNIEKELISAAGQSTEMSSKEFNNINVCNNDSTEKGSCQERYSHDDIKMLFEYSIMLDMQPMYREDIDAVIETLYDAMNSKKETIRISGEDKPTMVVIAKLNKLTYIDILHVIEKFNEQTKQIKNPSAYILTMLYKAKEQTTYDYTNRVNSDMQ